jgi:4-amino-4-deoxy-L-arabinose transferase-like glycosyltransferase
LNTRHYSLSGGRTGEQSKDVNETSTLKRLARDPEMWLALVLFWAAAIAYVHFAIQVVRWNDPTAYVYAGMRIAETGQPTYTDPRNALIGPYFALRGFKVQPQPGSETLYLTHAIGLPVLLALAIRLALISDAVLYVVPLLGVVGLVFLFILGRMLFGRWVGLLAAGLLTFTFGYWVYSTETWSDVPAVVFLLAGMVLGIQAARRNSLTWGVLGGLSLGYACLIRYPSVLALFPFAIYLLLSSRELPKPFRAWLGILAGLGVFCGLILLYNGAVYGGPFKSGYSPDHGWVPWPMFSWRNFVGQSPIGKGGIQLVLLTLWQNMHIGLVLAIVGLVLMPRPAAWLIGLNSLAFAILYAFYLWPSTDARFILLALPMIALAAAYTVREALDRVLKGRDSLVGAAAALVVLLWALPTWQGVTQELSGRNAHGKAVVEHIQSIVEDTEPNSVWLSHKYHDVIMFYGQRMALHYALLVPPDRERQRYDIEGYDARLTSIVDELLQQNTPVYIVKEPPDVQFRQGAIDPYPVLASHYTLAQIHDDPPVYRVAPD